MVVMKAGGGSGDEPYSHQGEEAGLVLDGAMELWVGERRFQLVAGDSFQFKSTTPHRFRNAANRETRVLWVVSPPFYGRNV
jgi:quercetin dioxygenase-like cupin family protein